jgi:hypothetical protein
MLVGVSLVYATYEFLTEQMGGGYGLEDLIAIVTGKVSGKEYAQLLIAERTSAIANPLTEHSFLSRVALWRFLIDATGNPVMALLGRGVGGLNADSLYFTYLAEFGYPGLIFIVWLLGIFILRGLRLIDTARHAKIVALAQGMTVINLTFAVMSITGTHIHYFPGDVYFWFWNGVLVKLAYIDAHDPGEWADNADSAHL